METTAGKPGGGRQEGAQGKYTWESPLEKTGGDINNILSVPSHLCGGIVIPLLTSVSLYVTIQQKSS
jgi:hypothetical protein